MGNSCHCQEKKVEALTVCFSDVEDAKAQMGYFLEVSNGQKSLVLGRGQCCLARVAGLLEFSILMQRGISNNPSRDNPDTIIIGHQIFDINEIPKSMPQHWSEFKGGEANSYVNVKVNISIMKVDCSDPSEQIERDFGLGPMTAYCDGTEDFMYTGELDPPDSEGCCS
eukprot:GEMP01046651.1.p1 GENE.GEMP01046651.1~~GEMP01046651.1.p1  ORF type:complete len:168 (+),score=35.53 GEMP01046651.1:224-727(+)